VPVLWAWYGVLPDSNITCKPEDGVTADRLFVVYYCGTFVPGHYEAWLDEMHVNNLPEARKAYRYSQPSSWLRHGDVDLKVVHAAVTLAVTIIGLRSILEWTETKDNTYCPLIGWA